MSLLTATDSSVGQDGSEPGRGPAATRGPGKERLTPKTGLDSRKAQRVSLRRSRRDEYEAAQRKFEEDTARRVRESLVRSSAMRDEALEASLGSIAEGKVLSARVGDSLGVIDSAHAKRQEGMYSDWCADVFGPICDSIDSGLAARDTSAIQARRIAESDKFLAAANNKAGLFLDIIMDDYDPFQEARSRIRYSQDRANDKDPLKRTLAKHREEATLLRGRTGQAPFQDRGMLDVRMWHTGKIESTPHGHFAAHMSPTAAKGEEDRMRKSHLFLDHFAPPATLDEVAAELPRGKHIVDAEKRKRRAVAPFAADHDGKA